VTGLLPRGVYGENLTLSCALVGRTCVASVECPLCEVSTSTAGLVMSWNEPAGSSALRLYVEIEALSALPVADESTSITSLYLLPVSRGSLFRGAEPTSVNVQVTRGFYEDIRDAVSYGLITGVVESKTGHVVETTDFTRGSQLPFENVQESNGVDVVISMRRLDSVLQSQLQDSQSAVTLSLSVLGALGTAFTVFGVILRTWEGCLFGWCATSAASCCGMSCLSFQFRC